MKKVAIISVIVLSILCIYKDYKHEYSDILPNICFYIYLLFSSFTYSLIRNLIKSEKHYLIAITSLNVFFIFLRIW